MTKTENTNQPNKKGIVIFAVVLVVLIGIFTAVYFVTRPAAQSGQKTVTIQVDPGEYGESTTYTVETDEEYLGPVLVKEGIAEGEESQFGLFIQTAGGVTADENRQEWWCITKGGQEVTTGADETPIADGDSFELTLKTGW